MLTICWLAAILGRTTMCGPPPALPLVATRRMEFAQKAMIESPGMPTAHRAFLINSSLAGRREEAKSCIAKNPARGAQDITRMDKRNGGMGAWRGPEEIRRGIPRGRPPIGLQR